MYNNYYRKRKFLIKHPYDIEITAISTPVTVEKNGMSISNINPRISQKFIEQYTDDEFIIENEAIIKIEKSNGLVLQSYQDKLLEARVQAFCYYKLNNFELTLTGLGKGEKGP